MTAPSRGGTNEPSGIAGVLADRRATDGAQAIATAAREPFDLIVTDYNMPLMDGPAFVSYLKQTPVTEGIPVVMVTTETDEKLLGPNPGAGVIAIFREEFCPDVVGPVLDKLF